jgi:hypothetical protein
MNSDGVITSFYEQCSKVAWVATLTDDHYSSFDEDGD